MRSPVGRFWARRASVIFSVFFVGLLLVACGPFESGPPPTPTPIPPTPTPAPTPTPTPTMDEKYPHQATWRFRNQSGYSYEMTIMLGEPMRFPESGSLRHPDSWDFLLEDVCSVDPQFDVVIPAYWVAEATTTGFATPISMRAIFASEGTGNRTNGDYTGRGVAPYRGDSRLRVAQNFSDGPKCSTFSSTDYWGYGGSSGFSVQWSDPFPHGRSAWHPFFIVVKDYYSPATPQGDKALLDWIILRPLSGGDMDNAGMVYSDSDGASLGIYSNRGITLSGKIIGP